MKPKHTVQDFAVCIGVAEIRKQVVDELINQWEVDAKRIGMVFLIGNVVEI